MNRRKSKYKFLYNDTVRIALLALAYLIFSQLGSYLKAPFEEMTAIWPASGIAISAILFYGRRLWPGVLIGAFVAHFLSSDIASISMGLKIAIAALFTMGAVLKVLAAHTLVKRIFGFPIKLYRALDILRLLFLIAPIACLAAIPFNYAAVYLAGYIPTTLIDDFVFMEWRADLLGVLFFAPLILFMPRPTTRIKWLGRSVPILPFFALLVILVPLVISLYSWRATSESLIEDAQSLFEATAAEGQEIVESRLESYEHLLIGVGAFIKSSDEVTPDELQSYVESIRLKTNFPGVIGLGKIKATNSSNPEITFISRENTRKDTLLTGKNPFDNPIKKEVLYAARDSGQITLSKPFYGIDSNEPFFWLVRPIYRVGMPRLTVEDRRKALRAWAYAPFIGSDLLENLGRGQDIRGLHLEVFIGDELSPENMIYDDHKTEDYDGHYRKPRYLYHETIIFGQQPWTLLWKSMESFEERNYSNYPLVILMGGLLFSFLFGLFIVMITMRNVDDPTLVEGKKQFVIPVIIFGLSCGLSLYLYNTLQIRETAVIKDFIERDVDKIEQLVKIESYEKLTAFERLADRWDAADGTPYDQWQDDAENYVNQLKGLRTLQWVDDTYHVRWVEPVAGNEEVIGLDIRFDEQRERALKGAAEKDGITLTPPINLVQGYKAFIAYAPLYPKGRFDGFMTGIFSVSEFFNQIDTNEIAEKYAITLEFNGEEVFANKTHKKRAVISSMKVSGGFSVIGKNWTIQVYPIKEYVQSERSYLPLIILFSTLITGFLLSLTIRYILISRLRSIDLQKSERTFRNAMESASIGMALVSPSGQWMTVNRALCDLLGYSEQELLETDFQSITHPEDLDQDLGYVHKMIKNELDAYQMEKRYFHKDGSLIWVLLSVSAVRGSDNEIKHFVSQIQDITARKQMDQMKSEFISIVSHELRTPLTSIRASLGLLDGDTAGKLPDKAKELVSIAYKNCERLILLINDILDLDKITAGKMRFDMEDVKLVSLIEHGIKENEGYAKKYNVSFNLHELPENIVVNVDRNRWQQVFANLVSNAAKFSPKGGSIDIYCDIKDGSVRLCIEDHGSGIPEEFRSQLFKKFSQADSTSTRIKGGTGLGLHISKQIVEMMSGTIGFETEVDEGSTFWFELPIVGERKLSLEDEKTLVNLASDKAISDRPVVLHVEDDEDFAKILAQSFSDKLEVVNTKTLREAKETITEREFSLIIIDIELPDGKGWTLIDYIREELGKAETPIIILTAYEAPDFLEEKVDGILVKSRNSDSEIVNKIFKLTGIKNKKGNL